MKFDDIFLKPVQTQKQRDIYQKDFTYKTKLIEFNMHYKHKMISVEELKTYLVDEETVIYHCTHDKPCGNFSQAWSCPPVAPSFDKYNKDEYKNCLVYAFWIDWNFQINSDNPYFKLLNANRTVTPFAWDYAIKLESRLGGKILTDGRCPICPKCAKKHNLPCKFPSRRRSSLEAVGIHATNLCETVLEHKISWYRKEGKRIIVPEYITAVNGFLTNAEQPKEMLE